MARVSPACRIVSRGKTKDSWAGQARKKESRMGIKRDGKRIGHKRNIREENLGIIQRDKSKRKNTKNVNIQLSNPFPEEKMMKRINLNLLRKTAVRSKREQRHASIVFRNGCPISVGINDEGMHSEESATRIRIPDLYKGCTMVNIRLTRAGRVALSRPCPACMELLRAKRFRKVIYSTNEGTFKEEYL